MKASSLDILILLPVCISCFLIGTAIAYANNETSDTGAILDVLVAPGSEEPVSADQVLGNAEVVTEGESLVSRVAPGEELPIVVKLINFGGGQRVDVIVSYELVDHGGESILELQETVAVETTASFIKKVLVPDGTPRGTYSAHASILYEGQVVPAVAQFQFTVEPKIFGVFLTDFLTYVSGTILAAMAAWFLSRLFIRRFRKSRIKPYEYEEVSDDQRLYYELISDTIMQMRLRVGDEALELAKDINGLETNAEGRVMRITKPPSQIIALLVLLYEKNLGERVSFSMRNRKSATDRVSRLKKVNKNIEVVRKYFQ